MKKSKEKMTQSAANSINPKEQSVSQYVMFNVISRDVHDFDANPTSNFTLPQHCDDVVCIVEMFSEHHVFEISEDHVFGIT
jgi:hypothetical protein